MFSGRHNGQTKQTALLVALLALVMTFVILQALPEQLQQQIRYDRDAISAGEWWRLMSGHFLHLGWVHLGLNLAGLTLIVSLFWQYWTFAALSFSLVCSLIAVSAGLWWLASEVHWYVGFSGILHGLLISGAILSFSRERLFSIAVMVIVVAKLGWEQITRSSTGTAALIGGNVLFDAHLYGFIGGLLAGLLLIFIRTRN